MSGPAPHDGFFPEGANLWDTHANWWKRTFTNGADIEYEKEILPLIAAQLAGFRRILDLGCGEGQASRLLSSAEGCAVVGLDASIAQLQNGVAAGGGVHYVNGAAERIPFQSESFEAVVCCLVIEHTDNADLVFGEIARVLAPGGCLLLLVNHPMYQGAQSGFVDDQILGEHYWRVGPYLHEEVDVELIDGEVAIPFAHRPLSRYVNPLAELELLLTKMFEPPPLREFLESSIDPDLEGAIPRLLAMRFEHRPRTVAPAVAQGERGSMEDSSRRHAP